MVIGGEQVRERNSGHDPDASTEPPMVIGGESNRGATSSGSRLLQRSRRW